MPKHEKPSRRGVGVADKPVGCIAACKTQCLPKGKRAGENVSASNEQQSAPRPHPILSEQEGCSQQICCTHDRLNKGKKTIYPTNLYIRQGSDKHPDDQHGGHDSQGHRSMSWGIWHQSDHQRQLVVSGYRKLARIRVHISPS